MDDAFGHWLAGFIDGEGSFSIHRASNGTTYRCAFGLGVRDDDRAIVDRICSETGLGVVYPAKAKRAVVWTVGTKAGCLALVALLDRYPLQARKAGDFAIWRAAVMLWSAMKKGHPGSWGQTVYDWAAIAELREQLITGRRYESPSARGA